MALAEPAEDGVRLGALEGLVGYHLRRTSALFFADFAHAVGDLGLRQVLFGILSIVEANPGINQGAVGRALGIQRANMVSLVNELVDRALLRREAAAADRRAFALTLTSQGRALFNEGHARLRAHEAGLLKRLSRAEQATLIALLTRLDEALD